ncbi:DNA-binding response regulator [Echinicola strongylocentroti]|uniref:DNA-binding response regulator n=1 Tax=Echinicola strongylocentroti TaxID=1795355 RepID=A0A2Z4II46_9BACT|nr:LytTR family DNA-binding domain-containing protein [Echinicola strongylocentroti]AWW30801.1 DNA-binding response regulator [Echinicola strongylocentroti]
MKVEKQFIQCLVVHKPDEGYRLSHQIHQVCEDAKTVAVLPSWDEAIQYLAENGKADVIFGSYELTDLHPSVFDKMNKFIPVVFTSSKPFVTEKAFALNCLDFINDNCSDERLTKTFQKFKLLYPKENNKEAKEKNVSADVGQSKKTRFLVKSGEQLFQKNQEDVAFFLADGGQTYLVEMISGEHYLVSNKLMDLEEQLDPSQFFRINRSIIINVKAIGAIKKHLNSRLKITPKVDFNDEIIVSREKVSKFKKWVNQ